MDIPFSPPDIGAKEIDSVVDSLKSGWITTGPKTKKFEKKISLYCGTNTTVCLNSATACMESTLRLLGIGEGDEVITSAYTYSASASVIDHVGAKIILVDVSPGSYEMDYKKLENAITEKTKAIIPVDIAGIMCDYEKIYEAIENKKRLFSADNELQAAFNRVIILADAAHSFGAKQNNLMSGKVADFTCFSFHAVKNLTTAEGGAVTWRTVNGIDDNYLYNQFMLLSLHGQSKDALAKSKLGSWEYDIEILGYKCNMTDIQAAIGLSQLERYPNLLKKRRELIDYYNQELDGLNIQTLNHYDKKNTSSGHLFMTNLIGRDVYSRNDLIVKLAEQGIATNVHYKPLPMHTAYKKLGFSMEDFPNSYNMYKNEITLPLYSLLKSEHIDYIVDNLKKNQ
ncbi:capsular biosynthesis protein [Carnobacterium maltaromaticum]|uniref:DegT/DnrJ/EryC1/StrS family aminotransferase n=1 Tax=Carnobacterium maltaromaticum TaxID=2751 RepID=UPI0010728CE8|nr:DegT/DnrJ/EryC1/StrS aminotransferase family protein [Carnobacterium maltaromaticum]TFJ24173.1 capsular biosynthesis protein [Carnobacterium maltaromaticum]TFJ29578.1 capsular biosynthesis protein [Carnobacterium maltaromaticum]TFJ32716.1 capsular biosynthesis protein [Carnobacterium maltaromaticum]TFJ34832.1 capsular biosynthesis protein [Carnobacterium maltaromaticum]TFJ42021.1 capsular biosynthesis protein [Carnobacterium maltaromaticum]